MTRDFNRAFAAMLLPSRTRFAPTGPCLAVRGSTRNPGGISDVRSKTVASRAYVRDGRQPAGDRAGPMGNAN